LSPSTRRPRSAADASYSIAGPDRVGVTRPGLWSEILNTDARELGGSGHGNLGGVDAAPVRANDRPFSLTITVPPLGAVFLRR